MGLFFFLRFQSNILKRHHESQSASPCKYGLADWLSPSRPLRNFNFINSAKIFPSGLSRPAAWGLGGHPAIPLLQADWPAQSGGVGTGGGECTAPARVFRGLLWHKIPAGADRGVSPLLFFVGPPQSGLQAAGIELAWAGSISARWTDARGCRLYRKGSAAE